MVEPKVRHLKYSMTSITTHASVGAKSLTKKSIDSMHKKLVQFKSDTNEIKLKKK